MRGVCRLLQIDAESIKKSDWIVFKRNNEIYKAERTESNGEFFISHIVDEREWRYIHPDDESRKDWDKFQKIFIETIENGASKVYPVRHSEWQVILNCLLNKEVYFKLNSDFDFNQYATIMGLVPKQKWYQLFTVKT